MKKELAKRSANQKTSDLRFSSTDSEGRDSSSAQKGPGAKAAGLRDREKGSTMRGAGYDSARDLSASQIKGYGSSEKSRNLEDERGYNSDRKKSSKNGDGYADLESEQNERSKRTLAQSK